VTGLTGGVAVLATEVACRGVVIAEGEAEVNAPDHEISFDDSALPGLIVQSHRQFDAILARARGLAALRTAVVWPSDAASLAGALRAMEAGLITACAPWRRGWAWT